MKHEAFKISISKKAQKYLNDLDRIDYDKIVSKIQKLALSDPQLDIKKLQGYKNIYRLRVNDYRVIYSMDIDLQLIQIAVIGHRKEVYDIAKRISF